MQRSQAADPRSTTTTTIIIIIIKRHNLTRAGPSASRAHDTNPITKPRDPHRPDPRANSASHGRPTARRVEADERPAGSRVPPPSASSNTRNGRDAQRAAIFVASEGVGGSVRGHGPAGLSSRMMRLPGHAGQRRRQRAYVHTQTLSSPRVQRVGVGCVIPQRLSGPPRQKALFCWRRSTMYPTDRRPGG